MYILPIVGIIGQDFNVTDLLMHLNAAKDHPQIKMIFDSNGGYVNIAGEMRSLLDSSGKQLYSTNSGNVASAAVELFLAAPKENRTFDTTKGEFLIHMPFIPPEDGVSGTADELQQVADALKNENKRLAKSYAKSTGTSANILEGFMNENKPLTPDQIQQLGFATIIQPQVLQAVALYNLNNNMDTKELKEKIGLIEGLIGKVHALFNPKALMLQDVNGAQLDFGNEVQDPAQIQPGVKATVDGKPADGEYVMADGSTLVFTAGELMEVKPAEPNELESLKKENAELKQQLEAQKAANAKASSDLESYKAETEKQLNTVRDELKNIKGLFSDGDEKDKGDKGNPDKTRRAFKKK